MNFVIWFLCWTIVTFFFSAYNSVKHLRLMNHCNQKNAFPISKWMCNAIPELFTTHFFYLKVVEWWTCCERDDDDEWRKRQTTDISSMAIPRLFFFQAWTACSTNLLAALGRSVVKETISIASWFEITSHIFYIQTKKSIGQYNILPK